MNRNTFQIVVILYIKFAVIYLILYVVTVGCIFFSFYEYEIVLVKEPVHGGSGSLYVDSRATIYCPMCNS
jgi:hypothetical protein